MLDSNTKMVFITAGMGGGTGTGAAPVIAQLAKDRGILTVGIVTKPFQFEGKVRYEQALIGVEKLRKQVDSLIVINNNKLREVYGNLGFKAGFSKADEVLATASRGIAEVITHHYTQNIDLKDAKTVLSDSGTAIMGSAVASGENRAKEAIIAALDSPLLDDNKITGAKNVLLLIVSGTSEITIDEIGEINDHIQTEAGFNANIIMGVGDDESLGEDIAVTIIATGFNVEQQNDIVNTEPKKIIHTLGTEQKLVQDLSSNKEIPSFDFSTFETATPQKEEKIIFELIEDEVEFDIVAETPAEVFETPIVETPIMETPVVETPKVETPTFTMDLVPTSEFLKNLEVTFEIVAPDLDQDYYFSAPEVNDIVVNSIQPIFEQEEQITFSFDLPIEKKETPKNEDILFQLTEETKNIFVNDPVQFVPMTELNEGGIVKYSLEEFMDVENKLANSKPVEAVVEEPIAEELNITVKEVEMTSNHNPFAEEISPMEMTIEESAKIIADERRRKLKEFNYKFHNNPSRVEELEKEPAYKRSGVDLAAPQQNNSNSRMSFGTDSNNDNQLRSNNSFLHDNVD
jgi:cell division protein FtsZ